MCKRKCMSLWYACILTHEMEWSTSSRNFLHGSIMERSTFKMDQTWPLLIFEKGNTWSFSCSLPHDKPQCKEREEKPWVMFFAFPFLWKCPDLPRVSTELSCLHPISFSYHIAPRKILIFCRRCVVGACCPSMRGKQEKEQEGESCYIELVVNSKIVCIR